MAVIDMGFCCMRLCCLVSCGGFVHTTGVHVQSHMLLLSVVAIHHDILIMISCGEDFSLNGSDYHI